MRKLTLPLMAVCALFAISAPSAVAAESTNVKQYKQIGKVRSAVKGLKAAIKVIQDIDKGQTDTVNLNQGKLDTVSGTVNSILEGVPAIVNGLQALKAGLESAGAGLVALKAGLESAGAGLTALSAAVQGPGIAGQLGAAGSAAPGAGNAATPSTLPVGTLYRQIILSSVANGALPAGTPIGARTWVKMPDAPGLYSNSYTCTAGRINGTASGTAAGTGGAPYASSLADCPAGS